MPYKKSIADNFFKGFVALYLIDVMIGRSISDLKYSHQNVLNLVVYKRFLFFLTYKFLVNFNWSNLLISEFNPNYDSLREK